MEHLYWELSVLKRAVAYENLSGASSHVGLSQPQLSRIVAKIESRLGVVLLDRAAKRKSSWTPVAHQLSEAYSKVERAMEREVVSVVEGGRPRHLHIGTLEGMIPLASRFGRALASEGVSQLEIDVHDLDELEELFFKGRFDVIFVSREPGKRKHSHLVRIGWQSVVRSLRSKGFSVYSTFEYGSMSKAARAKAGDDILVSNSLALRRHWLEEFGGKGSLPSTISQTRPGEDAEPVYMVAQETMSPAFWKQISNFKLGRGV